MVETTGYRTTSSLENYAIATSSNGSRRYAISCKPAIPGNKLVWSGSPVTKIDRRIPAETRRQYRYLPQGAILRLVNYQEQPVQGSVPHIANRRDLDRPGWAERQHQVKGIDCFDKLALHLCLWTATRNISVIPIPKRLSAWSHFPRPDIGLQYKGVALFDGTASRLLGHLDRLRFVEIAENKKCSHKGCIEFDIA